METRTPEEEGVSPEMQTDTVDDASAERVMNDDSHDVDHVESDTEPDLVGETRVAGLEEEVTTMKDRLLRQAAEFQNYRRRVEQERQGDVKFGQGLVFQQLLDVYDDLRRSIEAAEDAVQDETVDTQSALQKFLDGVELVFKKFTDELQRFGIEPIEALGTEFNEHEHEAMMAQPAPEGTAPGIVLGEIQKGYRMGDRVLRHSKVIVSA